MSIESRVSIHGVNHKSIEVEVRERFALNEDSSAEALDHMLGAPGVAEAVVLNTCNRVEVVTAGCPESTSESVQGFFSDLSGLSPANVANTIYHHRGSDAISHLFRVASGLDSLVLGEPQVFGQVKQAYHFAKDRGATKSILNRLFHRAFGIAKRVRTDTGIGRNAVSVCYAGKELAERIFGDLSSAKFMLIGAGEMGELALKHFKAAGVSSSFVVNRSVDRAVTLAESYGAVPLSLDQITEFLPQVDIIVGVTGIGEHLLKVEQVRDALRERWALPQFYIDLSVPRMFAPEIASLEDAYLYNIDDLEAVVKDNLDARALEVDSAELLIQQEVEKFESWLQVRNVADPIIKEVMEQGRLHRIDEIRRTRKRLQGAELSPEQMVAVEEALEELAQSLLAKTLHQPLKALKEDAAGDKDLLYIFEKLFLKR